MSEGVLEHHTREERADNQPKPHHVPRSRGPDDVIYIGEGQTSDEEEVNQMPQDSLRLMSDTKANQSGRTGCCISLFENE